MREREREIVGERELERREREIEKESERAGKRRKKEGVGERSFIIISLLFPFLSVISHLTYLDIRCIEISRCLSPTHSDCESTKFSASCCRCGISDCLKHSLYIRESSVDGIENEKE